MFRIPRLDILSFWLGFIAATLFWFLFIRIRPLLPKFLDWYKKFAREIRLRNLGGVNESLRKETIRRAQRNHLASSLFMLDEIVIPPLLLAPPLKIDPTVPGTAQSLAEQVIPYLPDWPELGSPYAVPTLTLAESLQNGSNIAVVGRPGSGKTVALAHFASLLSRQDPSTGSLSNRLPLYFHILDIDTHISGEAHDPLDNIQTAFLSKISVIVQPQLSRFLRDQFSESNVILIVDGLDELPSAAFAPVVQFFSTLLEKYPGNQIIAAANYESLNNLGKLGFVALPLTAWNDTQRTDYLERWTQHWNTNIAPDIFRQTSIQPVSSLLINNWLRGEKGTWSPMEWALKVWGAYTGDLKAASAIGSIETYISRFVGGSVSRTAIEGLAREFVLQGQASLHYNHLEKFLTSLAPVQKSSEDLIDENTNTKSPKASPKKGGDLISSVGELILISLTNNGLLVEHANSQISFVTPIFAGYLACFSLAGDDFEKVVHNAFWSYSLEAMRFSALRGHELRWIDSFLRAEEVPLYRHLLVAARWLPDSTGNIGWRSSVLRSLASLIQSEMLPLSLRARFIAAFVVSNDASVPKLFQQLCQSQSPIVRQLAALGSGSLGDPALINNLIDLLSDGEPCIRNAACYALAAVKSDQALSVVAGTLMQGDEELRQAAAESLILIPNLGPETIKEAIHVEDILTRRAAVFGLLQLREPWVKELLEKMAIEDGQWVVRNAASHALEALKNPNPHIPQKLPAAWESPWLIEFAAKRGQGVLPGENPIEILMLALVSGTSDDQLNALEYLKHQPGEKVIIELFKLFYGTHGEVQEAALNTLRHYSISGLVLPSPQQYGLG